MCGAQTVFRCFRSMERCADKLTAAVGPLFVTLAVALLTSGVVCFFDVIQPTLSFQIISLPLNALIALNLVMHYYYVCTVKPGFVDDPSPSPGRSVLWAKRRKERLGMDALEGYVNITKASLTTCRKCNVQRPERSHHCRVCGRCVLKYDHHCPWINQCVGLHNERHFVMFLGYLALSSLFFAILGFDHMWKLLGLSDDWEYIFNWPHHAPAVLFCLMYLLSAVIFLAVGTMGGWHLYSVMVAETSVEHHDNDTYQKYAKEKGQQFQNSFDVGKRKNLELFFNIGPNGYPIYTLFIPLRIVPYTDGRHWARRDGMDRHAGVRPGDELTDEEEA